MYPWRNADPSLPLLDWMPGLKPFKGTHPASARSWIESRWYDPERVIGPRRFRREFLRFYVSNVIERLTGARVFEFRNYKIV
jgi:hypothetical protein